MRDRQKPELRAIAAGWGGPFRRELGPGSHQGRGPVRTAVVNDQHAHKVGHLTGRRRAQVLEQLIESGSQAGLLVVGRQHDPQA